MRRPYLEHYVFPTVMPEIRSIGMERPWFWLAEGWRDFVTAPGLSLIYGMVAASLFAVISLLFSAQGLWHWAIALTCGFFLLGPIMAVGLYEISRRREGELKSTLRDSLHGWRRNIWVTSSLGGMLLVILMAWFINAYEMTALFVADTAVMSKVFGGEINLPTFLTSITWTMIAAATFAGVFWLIVTFLLTAVSVPFAADHEDVDFVTAIMVSVKAVLHNWRPMLLWAGLILVFAGIGILPFYLGLIFTFPLLGYATWHAYRDLIG